VERKYFLDLQTLLGYLQGKSAVLRTTTTLPKNRQACQGYIFLKYGKVLNCYVLSQAGALMLEGTNAYNQLSTSTEWYVRIDMEEAIEQELRSLMQRYGLTLHTLAPPDPSHATGRALRQKRPMDLAFVQQFPQNQSLLLRTVFTLVNGERTIAQIKAQLRYSPEVVDEALDMLHATGFIE